MFVSYSDLKNCERYKQWIRRAPNPKRERGGRQHISLSTIFLGNCMEIKMIGPSEGLSKCYYLDLPLAVSIPVIPVLHNE